MSLIEIWLIAIGLAMDCFTVSMASGIIQRQWNGRTVVVMATAFGLFQGAMPIIGWLFTRHLKDIVSSFDHWIAFILLAYLGGKMIFDGLKKGEEEHHFNPCSLKVVLTLAVATSIDALAIGISFACIGMSTWNSISLPVIIIGFTSLVLSAAGYGLGIYFGKKFHFPVEPVGGLILIAIGCRILCEHLAA
ncbi:MAG: manganese efflux pump [Bacteroidaceae bacterium]|nr:manganese efflux pump [Bacteroidaceae bacterium]